MSHEPFLPEGEQCLDTSVAHFTLIPNTLVSVETFSARNRNSIRVRWQLPDMHPCAYRKFTSHP